MKFFEDNSRSSRRRDACDRVLNFQAKNVQEAMDGPTDAVLDILVTRCFHLLPYRESARD